MRSFWQQPELSPDAVVTSLAEDAGQQRSWIASSSDRWAHALGFVLFGLIRCGLCSLKIKKRERSLLCQRSSTRTATVDASKSFALEQRSSLLFLRRFLLSER